MHNTHWTYYIIPFVKERIQLIAIKEVYSVYIHGMACLSGTLGAWLVYMGCITICN